MWTSDPKLRPWVDFNTRHMCKNFDQIRAWAEEHQNRFEPEDWWEQPGPDVKIWREIP